MEARGLFYWDIFKCQSKAKIRITLRSGAQFEGVKKDVTEDGKVKLLHEGRATEIDTREIVAWDHGV
jgi:transcriptional antiterminator Rof (Rho-off)